MLRRARPDEANVVADLWIRSRKASVPSNPPSIHDDDDVRNHFSTVVFPDQEVWVAERAGEVVGLMALHEGWVEHLHVEPAVTSQGIGSRLIDLAKERHPDSLDLWTFQSNAGARRFYERHGFVVVAMTDGDNEEGEPDVHFRWTRDSA